MSEEGINLGDRFLGPLLSGVKLRVLGDRLLVRPLPLRLSEVIHAPWTGRAIYGEVIASGPGEYPNKYNAKRDKMWKSKRFIPNTCKPGDVIHLGGMENGGYSHFLPVVLDGVQHLICQEKDVAGIESRARDVATR